MLIFGVGVFAVWWSEQSSIFEVREKYAVSILIDEVIWKSIFSLRLRTSSQEVPL